MEKSGFSLASAQNFVHIAPHGREPKPIDVREIRKLFLWKSTAI
jgi:hypothetical protein